MSILIYYLVRLLNSGHESCLVFFFHWRVLCPLVGFVYTAMFFFSFFFEFNPATYVIMVWGALAFLRSGSEIIFWDSTIDFPCVPTFQHAAFSIYDK
jgi:hypothetical protein